MPGVIRGLLHRAGDLAGSEVVLYDLDSERLRLMETLGGKMVAAAGADLAVRTEPALRAALVDADFVFTTFRPGGMAARHLDESIPLRYGVVGQETAGPGGFLMACRSVPVLLRIARLCDEVAPAAWIVNYTNPTNIVTDAVLRFGGGIRIVGLCDGHAGDLELWAALLGYPTTPGRMEADWIGLNHATWAERVRLDGADVSAEVRQRLASLEPPPGESSLLRQLTELGRAFGLLANAYAPYYFFHDDVAGELRAKGTTRAQEVMARLPDLYADYQAAAAREHPEPSRERGLMGRTSVPDRTGMVFRGRYRIRCEASPWQSTSTSGWRPKPPRRGTGASRCRPSWSTRSCGARRPPRRSWRRASPLMPPTSHSSADPPPPGVTQPAAGRRDLQGPPGRRSGCRRG